MKTKRVLLTIGFLMVLFVDTFAQNSKADSLAKRHDELMKIIMTQPKYPIKTIGVYVYDGYNTLDAIGPYQVLSELMGVDIFFVAKEKGFVKNQRGLKVQVDKSFADVEKLDILIIPGGAKETFMQTQDTTVLNWIRKIDKTSTYTTSVCTGGWILGATGLLKDKNVTCNWYDAAEIMKMYGANFKQERYVHDGKYWTSAGVSAGIDMALGIMNELMGDKYTKGVMLDLEYDPQPLYPDGNASKTEPIVKDMMTQMYDMGLKPLFDLEKKKKESATKKKPSVFEQWKALDEYHKVMSSTFHPAEKGDLKPLFQQANDLAAKATLLKNAPIPAALQKDGLPKTIALLEKESKALALLVKAKKSEEELKKAITKLHDRFHEIMEQCRD
jgi:putative intracellular protease/amidase